MKKTLLYFLLFLLFLTGVYFFSYIKMNRLSKHYYQQAIKNINNKDYIAALKGIKREKENSGGYIYEGGFQQVVDIWKSDYAWLKPDVYYFAKDRITDIINKIDVETGLTLFKKYNKKDRDYLSRVLLRVADLYKEKGDNENEKSTLEMVIEYFPLDNNIRSIAEQRLEKLTGKKNKLTINNKL